MKIVRRRHGSAVTLLSRPCCMLLPQHIYPGDGEVLVSLGGCDEFDRDRPVQHVIRREEATGSRLRNSGVASLIQRCRGKSAHDQNDVKATKMDTGWP